MIAWFDSLNSVVAGIVVVGGFVASTMVLGYLVQHFTSQEVRAEHNDRAGFILAVIGVVYAVLLGFVAIGVWDRFQQAEIRTYDEAGALASVYRDSRSFEHTDDLRATLRAYTNSVIHDEWPHMSQGNKSGLTDALLERIDAKVRALDVTTPAQADIHRQMIDATATALDNRETRLTIDFVGINGSMWAVLIAGAYLTVAFTYLFGFDRTIMQQLMILGLSLMIGLVLYLVMAMDFPYRGGIAVSPEAFKALLESWHS
ncbi:MAG TPA: hypothetical protein VGX91_04895 [Candidatus Cybelea sp.]|nr:hypothetical protein [Candidatus Cybelea sp.]